MERPQPLRSSDDEPSVEVALRGDYLLRFDTSSPKIPVMSSSLLGRDLSLG